VPHTCKPSYSGGRYQENHSSVRLGKWFVKTYLENTQHKKGMAK
jgi:hypothetical protein